MLNILYVSMGYSDATWASFFTSAPCIPIVGLWIVSLPN